MTLIVKEVTGGYSQIPVLKNVSFTVPDQKIIGLIGLNGAGKSTTIKHIIGLLKPKKGTITLNGVSFITDQQKYLQQIAYVPERPVLYPELTLQEHIDLTIMAYALDHDQAWQRAKKLLQRFRLANKLAWFPTEFSKGMQQKVMIVCAFMTNAKLFIIDEPFTGLDPLAMHDLLTIVSDKKKAGASILMSTHILATAQQYADEFVLLNHGQVQATGNLTALQQQFKMPTASLDDIYLKMTRDDRNE
ncbi:MAG: ABC transporter ATP-binding protein [Candidatus Paralactobacillus gallistercoris]|uniref:ABC transporter ATP-binding protein n=1 Tax=Candidatus Paralactobacillus gallistercoris TaxID=2838724 RepID=A0A948TJH6_9LACO|nr:ABC transporter ATP-binding protein [Candidatus Paralactobacillus gallistercoris]